MRQSSLAAIFAEFKRAHARYAICGGLAVVAHGYLRLTGDLDLTVDPEPRNLAGVVAVLDSLAYRPRAHVALRDLLDADLRRSWIDEKNLIAVSLWSPHHQATEIDLLPAPGIDIVAALERPVQFGCFAIGFRAAQTVRRVRARTPRSAAARLRCRGRHRRVLAHCGPPVVHFTAQTRQIQLSCVLRRRVLPAGHGNPFGALAGVACFGGAFGAGNPL